MAGVLLRATSGEVAIANGKTLLQVKAAAGHRTRVQGWGISFKGTSATDVPVLTQIVRQTTAGTMSAGSAGVSGIFRKNDTDAETIQTTATVNATAEPTSTDVVDDFEVHPQTGYRLFFPMGQEIYIPNGERLGLKVTSAALTYSAIGVMDLEE